MKPSSRSIEIAARIVRAYVTANRVPTGSLSDLVATLHRAILALDGPQSDPIRRPTLAQIKASIRHDAIFSFEDGKPYKALRRHLTQRGLTGEAYRSKWGLPADYPLVSASYSTRRSEISRQINLDQRIRGQRATE